MPFFVSRLPDLVIASGQTRSNVLKYREAFEDAEYLVLYGDNVTDGAITYLIQLSPNVDAAVVQWFTAQNSPPTPADIAPPLAGKAFPLSRAGAAASGAEGLSILASSAVTANRNWHVTKQWRVD